MGVPTVGLLGSNVLLNYRVGLDYAHSTVYFDIGRTYNFPDFDVIGLILRPEDDRRFTILGVADFDGKPSVPAGGDGVQPGDHLVAVNDDPGARVHHGTGLVHAGRNTRAGAEADDRARGKAASSWQRRCNIFWESCPMMRRQEEK